MQTDKHWGIKFLITEANTDEYRVIELRKER